MTPRIYRHDIIVLVGIPGAGKTSAGRVAATELGLKYVSAGEEKQGLLADLQIRKPLHELDQVESSLVNALHFKSLEAEAARPGNNGATPILTIVDTHASYILPDGSVVNLLPPLARINGVILLAAHENVVAARRIGRGRKRDCVKESAIAHEARMELAMATAFVTVANVPFKVLNTQQSIQVTAAQIGQTVMAWLDDEKLLTDHDYQDFIKRALSAWCT